MPTSVLHCSRADDDMVGETVEVPEIGSAVQLHATDDGRYYALVAPVDQDGSVDEGMWSELMELDQESAEAVNEALGTDFAPNA